MVFPVIGGTQDAEFNVSNSVRFDDGGSERLYFDQGSGDDTTARRKWTFSTWIKRSEIESSNHEYFFGVGDYTLIGFRKDDSGEADDLYVQSQNSGTATALQTNAKFRDTNAWYHIFARFDSTQGSASNRLVAYVNGVEVGSNYGGYGVDQTGSITQNEEDLEIGDSGTRISIGYSPNGTSSFFDGYMAETHLLIGSAKAHTDFGETNDNGVWVPIKTSFATSDYGSNGFKLEYKQTGTSANSSGIGADTSGNDNHFTVQNLNAQNVTEDVPTNNFCTFNPRFTGQRGTFSEGNTKLVTNVQGSVNYGQSVIGTFLLTAGKWYWEIEVDAVGSGGNVGIGVNERIDAGIYNNGHNNLGSTGTAFYKSDGNIQIGSGSNISNTSYTSGDIISVALDLDNSRIYWAKNGVYQSNGSGTGNPSTGANPITLTSSYDDGWVVFCSKDDTSNNATFIANFGNYPVAVSSGNTDGKYGIFEYEVPTGFYALCTKRLGEFG